MTPPASTYPQPLAGILETPSLNMFAGASGLGKTALLAGIARTFRDGGVLFGHPTEVPTAIGYISADRPWRDGQQWFTQAGFPDIAHYSIVDDLAFDVAQLRGKHGGPALLAYALEQLQLPPGALIIVDPIALFVGGNLMDYRLVAMACIEIQRYLLQHPACVIGVCHTAKLKADVKDRYQRPQDRILGTGALLGYSSTQMYLMGPEEAGREDGRYTFLWNPHHRPQASFLIKRPKELDGLFQLRYAVRDTSGDEPEETHADRVDAIGLTLEHRGILVALPAWGHSWSTAQVIRHFQLTIPRRTLFRRLDDLCILGLVHKPMRGCYGRTEVGDMEVAKDGSGTPDGGSDEGGDPSATT